MNCDNKADTVVYGTIYTSDANQNVAGAMAIKDGKYIYVGDKAGAEFYVGDNTKVIDQKDGMIMAGGTEAHGHYTIQSIGKFLVQLKAKTLAELKKEIRKYVVEHPDKKVIAGMGWKLGNDLAPNVDIDYAKELDEVCADKAMLFIDCDLHQLVTNSLALKLIFEIMSLDLVDAKKERVDTETFSGGVVLRLADGRPNGYFRDQAAMGLALLTSEAFSDEDCDMAIQDMQTTLYRQGYTNYHDALMNLYGNKVFEAIVRADNEGKLKICILPEFCVFAFQTLNDELINKAITNIEQFHRLSSPNIMPAGAKLFADGVTETMTGLNDIPYVGTNNCGLEILSEEQIYKVTKVANERGISVHTHTFGNVAVRNTINAYIKAQNEVNNGIRNTIAHARNVFPEDYKRMADNHIAVAENINWGSTLTENVVNAYIQKKNIPRKLMLTAYPIKSYIDNGVVVGSSTDAPASSDFPTDVFGIVEMAVDRTALAWMSGLSKDTKEKFENFGLTKDKLKAEDVLNMTECVSIKTALDIMTIGGARLMGIDDKRGSIEVGKSADFIIVNKNVLNCPTNEIHQTKTMKVYYEGELVYSLQ